MPITQLHKPFISVERPAPDAPRKWANHPLTRLAVGGAVAGLLYVLYSHAPDKGEGPPRAASWRAAAGRLCVTLRPVWAAVPGPSLPSAASRKPRTYNPRHG